MVVGGRNVLTIPDSSENKEEGNIPVNSNLEKYKAFFDSVYKAGPLDSKTKNLVAPWSLLGYRL